MGEDLSSTLKLFMLLAKHIEKHYKNIFYGKAQNLSRKLTMAYDEMLKKYDLIAMPTIPYKAYKLPGKNVELSKYRKLF